MLWRVFIVECGIARLSRRYMYSTFGHHPHPLDYLCAKFIFFHGLHCWASLWRTIAYSITHSIIIHPAYLMRHEPKLSLLNFHNQMHKSTENTIYYTIPRLCVFICLSNERGAVPGSGLAWHTVQILWKQKATSQTSQTYAALLCILHYCTVR